MMDSSHPWFAGVGGFEPTTHGLVSELRFGRKLIYNASFSPVTLSSLR